MPRRGADERLVALAGEPLEGDRGETGDLEAAVEKTLEKFGRIDWVVANKDTYNIRVLNLFGGNGYVTASALSGGASVVHVEADSELLELARANAGQQNVAWLQFLALCFCGCFHIELALSRAIVY